MFRKTLTVAVFMCVCLVSISFGTEANDCIEAGRLPMFDGTLSGMRRAYQIFDDCLNDPSCSDCATNRELIFLRALTGTAMLVIQDNGRRSQQCIGNRKAVRS